MLTYTPIVTSHRLNKEGAPCSPTKRQNMTPPTNPRTHTNTHTDRHISIYSPFNYIYVYIPYHQPTHLAVLAPRGDGPRVGRPRHVAHPVLVPVLMGLGVSSLIGMGDG